MKQLKDALVGKVTNLLTPSLETITRSFKDAVVALDALVEKNNNRITAIDGQVSVLLDEASDLGAENQEATAIRNNIAKLLNLKEEA